MAQMARRCWGESGGSVFRNSGRKRRNAARTVAGRSVKSRENLDLARQSSAELVHQAQGILAALMGQVQVDHGGSDLAVAEEFLDGVEVSPGFQQVGREAMAK